MRLFNYTFTIAISLFITGCASSGVTNAYRYGADDYKFLEKEYENLHPKVHFVLLKNEAEYNSARRQNLGVQWDTVSAFTLWIPETGECTVYIKDPEWQWEPELIGHEVAHCIWGRYHRGKEGLKPY